MRSGDTIEPTLDAALFPGASVEPLLATLLETARERIVTAAALDAPWREFRHSIDPRTTEPAQQAGIDLDLEPETTAFAQVARAALELLSLYSYRVSIPIDIGSTR